MGAIVKIILAFFSGLGRKFFNSIVVQIWGIVTAFAGMLAIIFKGLWQGVVDFFKSFFGSAAGSAAGSSGVFSVSVRLLGLGLVIAFFASLISAFIAVGATIAQTISAPIPPIITQCMNIFLPNNTVPCLIAVLTIRVACIAFSFRLHVYRLVRGIMFGA